MRILPNIPPEVLKHIQCHLTPLLGMSQTQAKDEFIRQACEVETYGMEPFQVMGEVRLGFKCYSIAEAKLLLSRAVSCKHFVRHLLTEQEKTCLESYNTSSDKVEASCELDCRMLPHADLDFNSDSSQSSEDDTQNMQSSGERHLVVTQPASSRFPPLPRHSVTVPLDTTTKPSDKYLNVPRKSFTGSMELQTALPDRPPHITEIIQLREQRNHFVTRSSINIAEYVLLTIYVYSE
ncbi:hypothetical protein AHF37_00133 [Paragonimus kellicotti]|nr:hypothetical protein AHF37_00133 [Paragonimus kellicotti]